MTPKTLLSIIHATEELDNARKAVSFASDTESHLAFAVIDVMPPPPGAVYYGPAEPCAEERSDILVAIKACADKLAAMLQNANISGEVSKHLLAGRASVASFAGVRARYSDLPLVFSCNGKGSRFREDVLAGLLFDSGGPVLCIPAGKIPTIEPKSVLIAWNGTRESARATHSALDFLVRARKAVIAMVDPLADKEHSGEEPGFDIASYLARHGVCVEVQRLPEGGRAPSDVLLRCALDQNAEMIVMGAYAHSRLREYVFGGTTRDMLEKADIPLFLSH